MVSQDTTLEKCPALRRMPCMNFSIFLSNSNQRGKIKGRYLEENTNVVGDFNDDIAKIVEISESMFFHRKYRWGKQWREYH